MFYDLFIPSLFPNFAVSKNPNSPIHELGAPITRQYCHSFSSASLIPLLINFPKVISKTQEPLAGHMQYVLLNKLSASTQIMRGTPTLLARGLVAPGGQSNPPVCFYLTFVQAS